MKKFLNNIIIILVLCTILTSCQKYLNVDSKSNSLFVKTAKDCQLLLDDYNTMNTLNYLTDGTASADEYFLVDNIYTSSAFTDEDRSFYKWDNAAIRLVGSDYGRSWVLVYKPVFQANLVLENVAKLRQNATSTTELDGLQGAALFYRSFIFWNIAQNYAKPYVKATASQDLGVPLRLTSDLNEKTYRATVQATYDQIINDLNLAVNLLPSTATTPARPCKAAAYAMLARVYLSMEDYPNALINATSSLNIYNQLLDFNTLSQTATRPIPRFNKEVLFQSIAINKLAFSPLNFSKVNLSIVSSYESNDLRSKVFLKDLSNDGFKNFNGSYEPLSGNNFVGLAVDEVYLTRAECYARAENVNAAMTDLNTLLRTRWKTGSYTDMTAASPVDALQKVLVERKKELLLRGLRWTDLRRLNHDPATAVTIMRLINGTTYTLPPNDPRYTLLIPQDVINNNPAIIQNVH